MLASLLLSLREGLEAALIIGIVLGVLLRLKRVDLNKQVWMGTGAAVLASLLVALMLNMLGMELEGRTEQIYEGVAMLLAASVLTWMILWMHNSAGNLKQEIEVQTRDAVQGNGGRGLLALAFLAVFREGVELALFLLAVQQTSSPVQTLSGALLGLAGAVVLGWFLFNSTRKLSLSGFFRTTNVLLIIIAAGMVAYGVHEFNEAGIIPPVIEHVWDINHILSDKSETGLLLKALVGYNGNPSLTELVAYLTYIGGIVTYVLTHKQKMTTATTGAAD